MFIASNNLSTGLFKTLDNTTSKSIIFSNCDISNSPYGFKLQMSDLSGLFLKPFKAGATQVRFQLY